MKKEEVKKILAGIITAYPNYRPGNMEDTVKTWEAMLSDYTYEQVFPALKAYILSDNRGFPPSIGQIVAKIHMPEEMNEIGDMQAWHMVYLAICDSAYHAEERFCELPETIRRAVGSPANLREWGQMETETVNSVIQSQFLRSYRAEVKRASDLRKLSADLLRQCGIDVDKQQDVPKKIEKEEAIAIEKKGVPAPDCFMDMVRKKL